MTALVAKRDQVLAEAIEKAISKGLPIDALSSDKKDYTVKIKSRFDIHIWMLADAQYFFLSVLFTFSYFPQGTGRLVRAFKAPRQLETPEERTRRQNRLEYNISRSKATKLEAESASTGKSSSSDGARGPSRGGEMEQRGRSPSRESEGQRGRRPDANSGGRTGARTRSPVTSAEGRSSRGLSRNTERGISRSQPRGASRSSGARSSSRSSSSSGAAPGRSSERSSRTFRSDSTERSSRSAGRPSSAGKGRSGGESGGRGDRRSSSAGKFSGKR